MQIVVDKLVQIYHQVADLVTMVRVQVAGRNVDQLLHALWVITVQTEIVSYRIHLVVEVVGEGLGIGAQAIQTVGVGAVIPTKTTAPTALGSFAPQIPSLALPERQEVRQLQEHSA